MEVEENESKPFDAELAQDVEETQPEPDEHMMTEAGIGRVWIVKVREPSITSDAPLDDPPIDPEIFDGTLGEHRSRECAPRHDPCL